MKTIKDSENKKIFTIIMVTVAVFAVAMIILKACEMAAERKHPDFVPRQEMATTTESEVLDDGMPDTVSTRTSMTGTYVDCLPLHDNFSEKICTPGFKTADNKYYGLDFSLMSQLKTELKAGDTFSANGLLTPIEMLSSDRWQGVVAAGIFSVTDSVKVEK